MKMKIQVLLILFNVSLSLCAVFTQQYFRVFPKNTKVLEGSEAVLECEISNLAGQVQWAKDGFALGYSSQIPGYPRYTMVGDRRSGVYNLRITNANLEDAAEYQCQVGPAQAHKVIRANASLTVIAPPTAVEIIGHPHNSKIEIKEGEEITLECHVKNAKPAAKIIWYRGAVQMDVEKHDQVIEVPTANGHPKGARYTTKSIINLKPTSEDDYSDISCEAKHEGVPRDVPMRSTVQLSVLYPPGAPYIEGYSEGETVRRGQTLELVCKSRGGNPPAQLIWYKNGEQIRMAYRTTGRVSENVLTFTADPSDNKARYRCEAKNIMISNTLKAEVDLTVLFAPTHVTISGQSEARVGDPVPLTCTTAASNPKADIKWMVNGKHFKEATSRTSISPEGGWITTSNITVTVEPNRRSIIVVCHGLNMQLTENVVSTHTINVLYPPSSPIISGYKQGTVLAAGTVQKLLCISSGGNPLASLTWFKNNKKIHSTTKATDKSVSSEISILTNVTDNLAQYRCEATNSATEIPLFETVTLNVHFAPETVKVYIEPSEVKVGTQARLICDAASSNPPAVLSWWRNGIPVKGLPATSKPGLHGGTVSSIELKLNVTKDLNGAVFLCQALNEVLQRSVHDAYTLEVLYPPTFDSTTLDLSVGNEDDTHLITVRADGNPSSITYTWTKDGLPITQAGLGNGNERMLSEGGYLNISRLSRADVGVYTCEAINSQGSAVINITLEVHYAATIKQISQGVILDPNEPAELYCTADGNPISEENFRWDRKDFDFTKTHITYNPKNNTSILRIEKPTREDVGHFECIVNNGIGEDSREKVMLIVKFKPDMDSGPEYSKSATNTGRPAQLKCKCLANPAPHFTWSRNGATLPVNATSKYYVTYHRLDDITYMSVLTIDNVNQNDFGGYECAARNEMGFATSAVKLSVTSAPDMVVSMKVVNITHNSVTLEWVPGFSGGVQPSYRIRYRKMYEDNYRYEDVSPLNLSTYTITNLDRSTDYLFSVMAINALGQSKYRPDDTRAITLSELPTSVPSNSDLGMTGSYGYPGMFVISGTIIGTALILLNVILIGVCLHKRTRKRIRGSSQVGELHTVPSQPIKTTDASKAVIVYASVAGAILVLLNLGLISCYFLKRRARRLKEQAAQSSKSATIEMYAPSSYNETMTGETMSSVSDKSDSYSDDNVDNAPPEVPAMPNRMSQPESFMIGANEFPPPHYPAPPAPPRTNTLRRNAPKQQYVQSPSPMPPLDGSYYNMSSDRYLSYPPMISEYMHQNQLEEMEPPIQFTTSPHSLPPMQIVQQNGVLQTNMAAPNSVGNSPHRSPPPNYQQEVNAMSLDRQSLSGTLRRQRLEKLAAAVPPPDVTVLHGNNCNQQMQNRSPPLPHHQPPEQVKQPQSILKDPSRQKYGYSTPLQTSTPNNSSQILTVQNLTGDMPQYGTIRKEKRNNVTIDESYNSHQTHVV